MSKYLFWIDLETTGLHEASDLILEIGALVTTSDLEVLDTLNLVVNRSEEDLARMSDRVREMHESSGLIEDVRRSTIKQEEAQKWLCELTHK